MTQVSRIVRDRWQAVAPVDASGAPASSESHTALIAVTPVEPAWETEAAPQRPRPSANFLAQLIATAQQYPQTRERRRAEPREAQAAYDAMARMSPRR